MTGPANERVKPAGGVDCVGRVLFWNAMLVESLPTSVLSSTALAGKWVLGCAAHPPAADSLSVAQPSRNVRVHPTTHGSVLLCGCEQSSSWYAWYVYSLAWWQTWLEVCPFIDNGCPGQCFLFVCFLLFCFFVCFLMNICTDIDWQRTKGHFKWK